MKPFDLQRALAGDKVVTRDGREVTQLHFFSLPNSDYPVFGVLNNEIRSWPKNGQARGKFESSCDLFMAPKTVKRWVNFFHSGCSYQANGFAFETEQAAKGAVFGASAIAIAVPVEFEEGYGCE